MAESRLTYDQFKADILQWKNSHREEYNRFARLMTNGDERQYLSICRAIFKQLPKVKTEWELCWGDDNKDDFNDIDLLFNEEAVPEQIVEAYQKQRDENKSSDKTDTRFWDKVKSFFSGKSERHGVILSAPLVLSWLYYGKSFEAMVSMVNKQAANPEADRMDRQSCSWVAKRIIQVSIKNGFRTQSDWDRYFSMNDAIEKGNIGEWALQSIINENGANGDMANDTTNTPTDTDCDATSKIHRTAGKKKIQERPLIDYLDCNNKEEVLGHIRNFISINTSAVHQALPFYVLKDLRLVAGMHTAKEYSVGMALQFPDLPSLKSESAIRQSVGFLKTAKYVIKEGKDQLAPLIESDENQELYQKLVQTITNITASNTTDISAK
ncbi:MAG: hypothetical protein KH395_09550 [Bacteroides sp.]|nr:hypothetical protein [Bacteroides sp.]